MRRSGSARDPIDAVLHGDNEGRDLLDVAALVHDLRAAYDPAEPLARGPQLTAFTVAGGPHAERLGRKRHSMLTGLSAFLGTLTGKVVLGTAVTAASVGGLHAADVVDVPVLPDTGPPTEQHDGDGGRPDTAGADAADDTAEGKAAAAAAYTDAVRAWTDCVAETAADQGDADTRTTGGFDPREACGDHPQPADFGLTELPAPAADAAADAVAGTPGATRPETPAPGGGAPDITIPSGAEAPAGGAGDSPAPETPAPGGGAPDITIPSGSDAPAGGSTAPAGHRP